MLLCAMLRNHDFPCVGSRKLPIEGDAFQYKITLFNIFMNDYIEKRYQNSGDWIKISSISKVWTHPLTTHFSGANENEQQAVVVSSTDWFFSQW
jgi:hypothetical protein